MTTTTMKIEEITDWGPAKRVETKRGPRMLRKASPTDNFWNAWRSAKDDLKAAGVSCGKDRAGNWEATWWLPLDAADQAKVDEAQAEVTRLEAKLANEQFRTRAPAAVVGKEEEKLAAARARLEGLQARLEELT